MLHERRTHADAGPGPTVSGRPGARRRVTPIHIHQEMTGPRYSRVGSNPAVNDVVTKTLNR